MASLKEQIQLDLFEAVRAKDETRRTTLRVLGAAIHNVEIERRAELDDEATLAVIQKQAKQRRESIAEYQRAGRQDLVDKEQAELTILETYLPAQADPAEVEAFARSVIAETGATGPRDMGKVMPRVMDAFAGRTDGRAVSDIVRRLLG